MALTLTIDTQRWRDHQRSVLAQVPGLVPVIKGNGYGFGLDVLAREALQLGVDTIAVGIAQEVERVRAAGWQGDVVVLNPWRPFDALATSLLSDPHIITTVSRPQDLAQLQQSHPNARVIVEMLTSMRRHGTTAAELSALDLGQLRLEGLACHLPSHGSLAEAKTLAQATTAEQAWWLSHLSFTDYAHFRTEVTSKSRMRVGTRLWLGDSGALKTLAHVLDIHPIKRGQKLGYHSVPAPTNGWILIISGGTAHGVAMSAPTPQRSLRQRFVTASTGLLDAAGRSLSPFTVGGKKRPFAEPPHMHSSMVFVAGSDPLVAVGDQVAVTTRMTTVTPDEIDWR